jgi:hypothetical protein
MARQNGNRWNTDNASEISHRDILIDIYKEGKP